MDIIDFSKYIAALLIVLGLLGGFAMLAKRGAIPGLLPGVSPFAGFGGPKPKRRLEVQEALILDPRRRMVIVRADDEEHVILLGPERETHLTTRPAKPVFEPVEPDLSEDDALHAQAALKEAAE